MQTRGAINQQLWGSGWSSQLRLWERQILEEKIMQTKERPAGAPSADVETQSANQPQNNTRVVFKRAEKPARFLIAPKLYEAICTNVRDPHWCPQWHKWQVRIEFALCGENPTPPLVQFVNCGKSKEGPEINGWLLQTLDAIGAHAPHELQGHDFYVEVTTTMRDKRGRSLPRHEQYSKVASSSLITGEQDLIDIENARARA